ncbi:MAG: chemotaxis-specific protein-glutamate methyltransferase CheB [Oscillochloridaceae bacterium]|nr:chemotaxis-specific protein-glutamate methyltransferase CheB [Chloroflexaceae bacterium]MDW8390004.1 chemotaxis-specific protein-glutamate methyltransferase CheB [Oscillochloridaceae bacterium]
MGDSLRILIVDDSPLMRSLLRQLLEWDSEIQVVGEAGDGQQGLALVAELKPDLVILDVQMPVMDGLETTRQIMAYHPTPILVFTGTMSNREVDITFEMLGAGALDVMEKPALADPAALELARRSLVRKIRLLSRVRVVTHLRGRRTRGQQRLASDPPAGPSPVCFPGRQEPSLALEAQPGLCPVVVIGASTGGPRVVRQILTALPADFPAAIIVVQHIADGFSAGMVEWLAQSVPLQVTLATEGMPIRPGHVLVAPDRYDLLVQPNGTIHLSGLPLLIQRPAIDIVMQSVAAVCAKQAVGVLLTGMGRDGAIGMLAIRRAGGYAIAQDGASCAIFGMPRAAIELGAADIVLPPQQIAAALCQRLAAGPYARRPSRGS